MFKSRKVNGATRVECRWGGGVGVLAWGGKIRSDEQRRTWRPLVT